jgi:hypothetical protein
MVKTRLKLLLISVPFAYHIACLAENTKHEVFPVLADIILLVYCFFFRFGLVCNLKLQKNSNYIRPVCPSVSM